MVNKLKRYNDSDAKKLLKFLPIDYPDWSTYDPDDPQFKRYVVWVHEGTKFSAYSYYIVSLFRRSQRMFLQNIASNPPNVKKVYTKIYNFIYKVSLEDTPAYLGDSLLGPYAAWRLYIAK